MCVFIFSFYKKLTLGPYVSVASYSFFFLEQVPKLYKVRIPENLDLFLQLKSELGGSSRQDSQDYAFYTTPHNLRELSYLEITKVDECSKSLLSIL